MKHSILSYLITASCFFFTHTVFAQIAPTTEAELTSPISKGNWLIGGNILISSEQNFSTKSKRKNFTPTVGYFLADKFLVGTEISLFQSKLDRINLGNDFKVSSFQVSPMLRYYLGDNKIKPYLQLTGVWNSSKVSGGDSFAFESFTMNKGALLGQLGFDLFLSPNAAFNLHLSGLIAGDKLDLSLLEENFYTGFQRRIIMGAGMNFYLTGKDNRSTNKTDSPLVERFFQKGNRTIGVTGSLNFDPFYVQGSIYTRKFKSAKSRRNLLVDSFLGEGFFGGDFGGVILLRPELEHFIKLNDQFFFTPAIGVGLATSFGGGGSDFSVNAQFYPKLLYFLNRVILDAGLQINSPFTQFTGNSGSDTWIGSFVVGGDYFIQDNLSLRGEVYIQTFGYQQFGYSPIYDILPKNVFRIGINYFIGN